MFITSLKILLNRVPIQKNNYHQTHHSNTLLKHVPNAPYASVSSQKKNRKHIQYLQQLRKAVHSHVKPTMKTGYSSFTELRLENSDYAYVDKSLFIKEILENQKTVILLTRPRQWGKSLNLQMLKTFLEIEVDQIGILLPEKQKKNHKFFIGGEIDTGYDEVKILKALRKLKIAEYPDILSKYQGQFPVIHMDLEEIEYRQVVSSFMKVLNHMFQEHKYLHIHYAENGTDLLTANQKSVLIRYMWYHRNTRPMEIDELEDGLRFLMEVLYKHFKRKVYVLVDGYPTPIYRTYEAHGDTSEEFKNITQLFRNMFNKAFKDNLYLEKAIITGGKRIAGINLFDDLDADIVAEYGAFVDNEFSQYYGFTQHEVDELLKKIPTKQHPSKIKSLHNGYNYEGTIMYSPQAIVNAIDYNERPQQEIAQDTGLFFQLESVLISDKYQERLHSLLQSKSLISKVHKQISLPKMDNCTCTFYSVLVMEGFVDLIPVSGNVQPPKYHLVIANRNVGRFFVACAGRYVRRALSIPYYQDYVELLHQGSIDELRKEFQEDIQTAWNLDPEIHFFNLVSGLVSILAWEHEYRVSLKKDTANWKCEYILVPQISGEQNLILFIGKLEKSKEDVSVAAKNGLDQINDPSYCTKVKQMLAGNDGVKKIVKVGFALCSADVAIEYQIDNVTKHN